MSSNPYENEPGFESANDEIDKKNQKDYVMKVTLPISTHLDMNNLYLCRFATNPYA